MKWAERSVHSRVSRRARVAYPLLCVLVSGVAVMATADPAFAAPPDAPAQPTVVAQNASIEVSFVAPADGGSPITSYTAACTSSNGGAPGTQTGASSPILVSGLTNGDTYTCTVFASNADGDGTLSPASAPAVPSTVPDAPAAPTAVAVDASIVVSFAAPADGGSPITSFTASCTSSDGGAAGLQAGGASPVTVANLTPGKTYTCTLFASNANGAGPASAASNQVTMAVVPGTIAAPSVARGAGSVIVTFAPPASDGGSPITGYTAACLSSTGGATGTTSGPSSPITVTALTNGATYTCTVFASNANGDGPVSAASPAVVPSTVPDAPAAPTLVAQNAALAVIFVAPSDGGSAITGYTASCTSSDGGAPGTVLGLVSPIVVSGLTNGKTYSCTVSASNVNGDGPVSVSSAGAVPNTVPDAPAPPAVVGGNASIRVTFAAPTNAGSPITGYTATCSTAGAADVVVPGAGSPITVTGLRNGSTYTCTVFASNASGAGPQSTPSSKVLVATTPGRPAAPAVAAGNGRVTVTVRAPANGGAAITSYLARCTSTNGGGSHTATSKSNVITVAGLVNGYTFQCLASATNSRGTGPTSALSSTIVPFANGYRLFSGDGGIFTFGASGFYGSAVGRARALVISMATTRDNKGYWLASRTGEVFNFGDARYFGSMATVHLNKPVVGIAASPTGRGYWLVASDGGIFAFGDARFYGSTGNIRLNQPIVGMTPTATGRGYWFVAADGGLFSYGDARFYGSAAGRTSQQIIGMATSGTGHGYWIATIAGQVFSFGDAPSFRSGPLPGLRLPIMGIVASPSGRGYWLGAADGGVFGFGDAPYFRWPGPLTLRRIIRGISR